MVLRERLCLSPVDALEPVDVEDAHRSRRASKRKTSEEGKERKKVNVRASGQRRPAVSSGLRPWTTLHAPPALTRGRRGLEKREEERAVNDEW